MPGRQFGLLGRNISYSFSKKYFSEKFEPEHLTECSYENFDIQSIDEFRNIIKTIPNLSGLNVTIPYKESVIPYLNKLSKKAAQIGAVNVIRITKKGKLKGYNSDYYGFMKSLKPLLKPHHKKALILGTGGAAKAVAFGLDHLDIAFTFVSRNNAEGSLNYNQIDAKTFDEYQIIINCTPLGTSPDISLCPDLPYECFTKEHIAYDLIYNPEETEFLQRAKKQGAIIKNGYDMLVLQAEKAWKIWNK